MDYAALLQSVQNNDAVLSEHGRGLEGFLHVLEEHGIRFEDAFRVAVGRAIKTLAQRHGVSELEIWLRIEGRENLVSLVALYLEGLTTGLALR